MNSYERINRAAKVSAILAVIDSLEDRPSADDVAAWPEHLWLTLAEVAQLKSPPSETTRKLVERELRMAERAKETV